VIKPKHRKKLMLSRILRHSMKKILPTSPRRSKRGTETPLKIQQPLEIPTQNDLYSKLEHTVTGAGIEAVISSKKNSKD